MTYESKYGQIEGLPDRLEAAATRLGRDKALPWVGMGLIADLEAAAAALRGKPLSVPDKIAKKIMEFDL